MVDALVGSTGKVMTDAKEKSNSTVGNGPGRSCYGKVRHSANASVWEGTLKCDFQRKRWYNFPSALKVYATPWAYAKPI
jgi:hypothetical protein